MKIKYKKMFSVERNKKNVIEKCQKKLIDYQYYNNFKIYIISF